MRLSASLTEHAPFFIETFLLVYAFVVCAKAALGL